MFLIRLGIIYLNSIREISYLPLDLTSSNKNDFIYDLIFHCHDILFKKNKSFNHKSAFLSNYFGLISISDLGMVK
jgi:hypothetical protein